MIGLRNEPSDDAQSTCQLYDRHTRYKFKHPLKADPSLNASVRRDNTGFNMPLTMTD